MTVTLYLVRHGETDWNLAGRLQGQTDTDLTERGQNQARLVGNFFAHQGLPIDRAVSSDLKRTRRTAETIISCTGRTLAVDEDPRLRERHLGVLQGLTHDESATKQPQSWSALERGGAPDGGESVEQLQQRGEEAIRDIATAAAADESVLIVSHLPRSGSDALASR